MSSPSNPNSAYARRAKNAHDEEQDLEIVTDTRQPRQSTSLARHHTPQRSAEAPIPSPTLIPHARPPLEDPFILTAKGLESHAGGTTLSSFHNRCISVASSSGSFEGFSSSPGSRSATHAAPASHAGQRRKIPSTMFAVNNNAGANAQAGPDLPEIQTEV